MPEQTQNKTDLLVDPSEAFVDLLKIPDKPTRLQRLGGSPSRWVGLILLALIWAPSIVHYRNLSKAGKFPWPSFGHSQATVSYPPITITKGVWSDEINTTGRKFRVIDITPPARRWVMVNNNSSRVYPLPAGPANEVFVGDGVKSLKWMIMADEAVQSSTIKYDLH